MSGLRVVEWVDSSLQNGQVGKDDYPKPELIRSVGWLVSEDDEQVTLARDDMKDDEYRGLLCIPRACIKSVRDELGDPVFNCPCGDPVGDKCCTVAEPCGYRVSGAQATRP